MSSELNLNVVKEKGGVPSDVAQMEANLEKLCCLSKDDKTENGMLRSRIDEQSRLIMMLKQRADEEINRVKTLDRANKELSDLRDDFSDRWKRETLTSNMLDKRFHELASNHEEMIKIKDEYKRSNSVLRADNSRLKEENGRLFNAALQEKTQQLDDAHEALSQLQERNKALEIRVRDFQKELNAKEVLHKSIMAELTQRHTNEANTLNNTVSQLQERLKGASQELERLGECRKTQSQEDNTRLQQIIKEKNEMLELAMQRGKLINKEQDVNKAMKNRVTEMEINVRNMQEKFEREAAAVNVNLRVRELREDLAQREGEYKEMEQKFEAYKKHTSSLLHKERELNKTLRHLAT